VDENAPQVNRKDLEAQLSTLTPGEHSLYLVTPPLWERAQDDKTADPTSSFNPIKVKKVLIVK
jgi:hypothetical protein